MAILTTIKVRRDTAANWITANPILADGELGLETDTRLTKFGDGVSTWTTLLYANETRGTWTPIVTASSGTITTKTASGYYTKVGRQVHATLTINITTNGTGASLVNATLPFTAAAGPLWIGAGRESAVTGNMLQAIVQPGATVVNIATYANAYPGGNGTALTVSFSYFV